MSTQAKGWRDVPRGAVIDEPGNAREYLTGDWRTVRPIWHPNRCIHCLFCWVYCPDAAVMVKDGRMQGFSYEHCKGCGICAAECPKRANAITMAKESAAEAALKDAAAEAAAAADKPGSKKGGGC